MTDILTAQKTEIENKIRNAFDLLGASYIDYNDNIENTLESFRQTYDLTKLNASSLEAHVLVDLVKPKKPGDPKGRLVLCTDSPDVALKDNEVTVSFCYRWE